MKRLTALHWLTALALIMGQWGMLAHAGEHPLEGVDDRLCVLCLQGQSLEQMQIAASSTMAASKSAFTSPLPPPCRSSSGAVSKPNIRGPPALLQI